MAAMASRGAGSPIVSARLSAENHQLDGSKLDHARSERGHAAQEHSCRRSTGLQTAHGAGPGEDQGPQKINVFLIRKSDHSRLCLAAGDEGHTNHDDNVSGSNVANTFAIDGTGFGDSTAELFNKMTVEVLMELSRDDMLTDVIIQLEDANYDEFIDSSVESLLQVVESPGFASRWAEKSPLPAKAESREMTQAKKKMRPTVTGAVTNVLQLLTETVMVRSKTPAVMTQFFAQLEAKDLMQASEVSRS